MDAKEIRANFKFMLLVAILTFSSDCKEKVITEKKMELTDSSKTILELLKKNNVEGIVKMLNEGGLTYIFGDAVIDLNYDKAKDDFKKTDIYTYLYDSEKVKKKWNSPDLVSFQEAFSHSEKIKECSKKPCHNQNNFYIHAEYGFFNYYIYYDCFEKYGCIILSFYTNPK
ncbi:MAG: hypothetical protein L6Q54_10255 [Leptospiraceae bacterium]|nr:hypothetical protein [Leptospiraceae bacterium]